MNARKWAPQLTILCLGIAAYAPTLPAGFLYDDHLLIEANSRLRSWSVSNLKHDFTSGIFESSGNSVPFYRPLQTFSTRVEYSLVQRRPLLFHLTNLLLHLGNALLLYELLLALGVTPLTAVLAGCLFVAHPIIVEPMLMVSGRGEQLGLFFTLGCILLYLRNTVASRILSLGSFLLALFSKESAIITPALLLAALYLKGERLWRPRFLAAMAAVGVFYFALRQHALGNTWPALASLRPGHFLVIAFPSVLMRYARILLIPWDLHTDRLLPPPGPVWGLATLGVAGLGVWLVYRGPRWAVFCFLWYVLSFLPKSVMMMSSSFMSDHWAYAALPAVALPVALALARGWNSRQRTQRRTAYAICAVLILTEVALVHWNVSERNTDEKLYRSALRHSSSPAMRYNLSLVLLNQGRPDEAVSHLELLLQTDPTVNVSRALAWAYWQQGRRPLALKTLEHTLGQTPDDTTTRKLLEELKKESAE